MRACFKNHADPLKEGRLCPQATTEVNTSLHKVNYMITLPMNPLCFWHWTLKFLPFTREATFDFLLIFNDAKNAW